MKGEAGDRIRATAAARRVVAAGEWTRDALRRNRLVLENLDEVRAALDDDGVPKRPARGRAGRPEGARTGKAGNDPLAAVTQDVLERFQAAELPVAVLARALDQIRLSQSMGHEAAKESRQNNLPVSWPVLLCSAL